MNSPSKRQPVLFMNHVIEISSSDPIYNLNHSKPNNSVVDRIRRQTLLNLFPHLSTPKDPHLTCVIQDHDVQQCELDNIIYLNPDQDQIVHNIFFIQLCRNLYISSKRHTHYSIFHPTNTYILGVPVAQF